MKLKKLLCLFTLTFFTTLCIINLLALGESAEPYLPVHNINTGLDYATIQEAINANPTLDGHIIQVDAGTYHEQILVYKSLTLVGQNKSNTIIDGGGVGDVIYVTVDNVSVAGFTIQNGEKTPRHGGIHLYQSSGNNMSNNVIRNNYHGIYLDHSNNNTLSGNNASDNYSGFWLSNSGDNNVSDNNVSNNEYGISLYYSGDNDVSDNDVSNNEYGMFLYFSNSSILTSNNVFSNKYYGTWLYHSNNNILTNNSFLNTGDAVSLTTSNNNIVTCNNVSNNEYGISLYYSGDNDVSDNDVSNNEYGISLTTSNNNTFFHNNFINNTHPSSSTNSTNSWHSAVEGNYWSDHESADANRDGIGDTPYQIDEKNQDNYPLMALFIQFRIAMENRSYAVDIVSNSTISQFQHHHDPNNKTNALSFKLSGFEGTGFCRICIPHILVWPPFKVTVDNNPPLYNNTVRTNGTHTWLYFTYYHSEHEVTILQAPKPPPIHVIIIWRQWWFWAISGLAAVTAVSLSFSFKYHRMLNKQNKLIQKYERELESLSRGSPVNIARVLFKEDVNRRTVKITKFEQKYGVRIRPRDTLEEVIRSLEMKDEVKN